MKQRINVIFWLLIFNLFSCNSIDNKKNRTSNFENIPNYNYMKDEYLDSLISINLEHKKDSTLRNKLEKMSRAKNMFDYYKFIISALKIEKKITSISLNNWKTAIDNINRKIINNNFYNEEYKVKNENFKLLKSPKFRKKILEIEMQRIDSFSHLSYKYISDN